jgi:hypothetical protein
LSFRWGHFGEITNDQRDINISFVKHFLRNYKKIKNGRCRAAPEKLPGRILSYPRQADGTRTQRGVQAETPFLFFREMW